MTTDLIQHHEPFDIMQFYETVRTGYIGIDYRDFETFMSNDGEKHSFIGEADGAERIRQALANAMKTREADDIIRRASAIAVTVVLQPEAVRPVKMNEMRALTEFIAGLDDNCEVSLGITEARLPGNMVRIILLVNIK